MYGSSIVLHAVRNAEFPNSHIGKLEALTMDYSTTNYSFLPGDWKRPNYNFEALC